MIAHQHRVAIARARIDEAAIAAVGQCITDDAAAAAIAPHDLYAPRWLRGFAHQDRAGHQLGQPQRQLAIGLLRRRRAQGRTRRDRGDHTKGAVGGHRANHLIHRGRLDVLVGRDASQTTAVAHAAP